MGRLAGSADVADGVTGKRDGSGGVRLAGREMAEGAETCDSARAV